MFVVCVHVCVHVCACTCVCSSTWHGHNVYECDYTIGMKEKSIIFTEKKLVLIQIVTLPLS